MVGRAGWLGRVVLAESACFPAQVKKIDIIRPLRSWPTVSTGVLFLKSPSYFTYYAIEFLSFPYYR